MKKHPLNYQKAKKYFDESLNGVNELSNDIISLLKFDSGNFFALLADDSSVEDIHNFKVGGRTRSLINEVGDLICSLLKSDGKVLCIFDDFNADSKNIEGDLLFNSNGLICDGEIYYLIKENPDLNLVVQCLRRSNVAWHSLCVISDFKLKKNQKEISQDEMKEICLGAKIIMIGAYDAEGYIMWKKDS